MRRIAPLLAGMLALGLAPTAQALTTTQLRSKLAREMRLAGPRAGAYVVDLDADRPLFALRENVARVPASVQKLYTTATALLRYGSAERLVTTVHVLGTVDLAGTLHGNLYLRGSGDPTFGSARFARRAYGGGATTATLAQAVADAGVRAIDGRVVGDESLFDRLRGGPESGYRLDWDIGNLSALAFNRGLANERGTAFQADPARFAAGQLALELRRLDVDVPAATRAARRPEGTTELARVESPPMRTLVRLTNRPSDNFFAEMLLKGLGARFRSQGSTAGGASVVRSEMVSLGIHPRIVDGSGLAKSNRTTPRQVVRLLDRMDGQEVADSFITSLAVAGRNGTLAKRMRRTPAAGRCRAKTGTLRGVSALAGYCPTRSGARVAFAFLMNGVNIYSARRIQDRMTAALARYEGS
jgi:D-alanyl-D-alanine carboxypeptidase/D-alanyl-D-alanine-endopeptidase (penicillin-binding protein 4)